MGRGRVDLGKVRFLVLDELHTYRGRQGADVAMLVRRVRDAFNAPNLQCVGTSATLAGAGTLLRSVTNSEGAFTIASLTPGTYEVTVSLDGFKTFIVKDVVLTAVQGAAVRAYSPTVKEPG